MSAKSRAKQVDCSVCVCVCVCRSRAHTRRTARCRAPKSRDFPKRFSPNRIFQADWLAPDSSSPVFRRFYRGKVHLRVRKRKRDREKRKARDCKSNRSSTNGRVYMHASTYERYETFRRFSMDKKKRNRKRVRACRARSA